MAEVITPEIIDQHARELIELQAIAEEASEAVAKKKDDLLPIIKKHGRSPDRATKTVRLEGNEYHIDANFGQSTSLVPDAVESLKDGLKTVDQARLFPKLFRQDKKYVAIKGTSGLIAALPQKIRTKVQRWYDGCFKVEDRKPTVNAEPKKAEKAQKASA